MLHAPAGAAPRKLALPWLIILLALGLNLVAWIGATLGPGAQASWRYVSLLLVYLVGLVIGRWWALLVTCAFGIIHAIPVYLGLLPGYLSTWGEALWWAFALGLMVMITGLGVLTRRVVRRLRRPAGWANAD